MATKPQYWKGLEELNRDPEFVSANKNEFAEGLPLDDVLKENDLQLNSNRRDFLKYFGFSVSAVALAACNRAPVKNVIPYVVKPEEITPGIPNWYASAYGNTSVLVKTREGRPIKLEGNPKSDITGGGLDAIAQASVLSLYDTARFRAPLKNGEEVSWADADKAISAELAKISGSGKAIALITGSINSPSTLAAINEFKTKYTTAKHISYDAVSYSGLIEAHESAFGKAGVPAYMFDKAEVIVGFDCDFLGTWLAPVQFSSQWVKNRKLTENKKTMSKHYQFESILSLTGSNSDYRATYKPSDEATVIANLYNAIAAQSGSGSISGVKSMDLAGGLLKSAAADLLANRGKSLVVSGSNNKFIQMMVAGINQMLGNYGQTLDIANHSLQATATDKGMAEAISMIAKGEAGAVIFWNCNPVYNHPNGNALAEAIKKASLSINISTHPNESSDLCTWQCPDHHYLESWNDAEIIKGKYAFTQPAIINVFNTRQGQESLLRWSGNNVSYYDFMRQNWSKTWGANLDTAWNKAVHDGVFSSTSEQGSAAFSGINTEEIAAKIAAIKAGGKFELIAYQKVGLRDGAEANNPWLQELPDPITKTTWDNYACLSKSTADEIGVKDGDLVKIVTDKQTIESIPVLIQPGQARGTVAVAVGYGRTVCGNVGNNVGHNIYPSRTLSDGNILNWNGNVSEISKVIGSYQLARTQTHSSIEGRNLVREAPLPNYLQNPGIRNEDHLGLFRDKNGSLITLWQKQDNKGHKWGMAIDLNACTGCGACIVSCNAENNVPVVGRDEVRRSREMHWIRIDRYYRFSPETENPNDKQTGMGFTESGDIGLQNDGYTYHPEMYDSVSTTHVPMICQHCGNAPCETVCPVLATTHSSEGLNQMTYNRCIGTKYCANNCPYKVRRFNWFRYNDNDNFDYYLNNDLGKMVINPDVTVRTRGVMEKCSFCIQRIQYGKLQAKLEGRKVKDGEIKTACQQSCPTGALVFGDLKDPESEISKLYRNQRSYHMLEELNVQPSVVYMTKVRNTAEEKQAHKAHS